VTNCRWCENVGRAHKSNHIYWVVDVHNGTYCQRCHDPECRFFSSPSRSLPQDCAISRPVASPQRCSSLGGRVEKEVRCHCNFCRHAVCYCKFCAPILLILPASNEEFFCHCVLRWESNSMIFFVGKGKREN
jgi:hypothetical protein